MEGNLAPLQAMSSLQHEFHQVNGDKFVLYCEYCGLRQQSPSHSPRLGV